MVQQQPVSDRALIDTHLLVWWLIHSAKLPSAARKMIENPEAEILVSAVSVWELAIKISRRKIEMKIDDLLDAIEDNRIATLPITFRHAAAASTLPWHHADPFDRMLVAQAKTENIRLLTADRLLAAYGDPVTLV